jgi:hypothetical protein
MPRLLLACGLILASYALASAAVRVTGQCPQVIISGHEQPVSAEGTLNLSATLTDALPGKWVYFNWTSTWGTITSGDGTSAITLKQREGYSAPAVYVDVIGEGIPRGCTVRDYRLIGIKGHSLSSPYFDYYIDHPAEQELLHLRNFASEFKQETDARAYLVVTRSADEGTDANAKRLQRIKWLLTDQFGIAADRIIGIDRGVNEYPSVKLFVLPKGYEPSDVDEDW